MYNYVHVPDYYVWKNNLNVSFMIVYFLWILLSLLFRANTDWSKPERHQTFRPIWVDKSGRAGVSFPLAVASMAQLMLGYPQDNVNATHCRHYCHADNGARKLGCLQNCHVECLRWPPLICTSVTPRLKSEGLCAHRHSEKTGFISKSSCNSTRNSHPPSLDS